VVVVPVLETTMLNATTTAPPPPISERVWYKDWKIDAALITMGVIFILPYLCQKLRGFITYAQKRSNEHSLGVAAYASSFRDRSVLQRIKRYTIGIWTYIEQWTIGIWTYIEQWTIETVTHNNNYIEMVMYFLRDTVFSKLSLILCASTYWTWFVRDGTVDGNPDYDKQSKNLSVLNTAATGLLTFLLSMRLNNALAANRLGFDRYCTTCSYLEMFQQRARTTGCKYVCELIVFIPFIIKHELRGTFNPRLLDLFKFGEESLNDKPSNLNAFLETLSHDNETEDFINKLNVTGEPGRVCERIEQLVLFLLYKQNRWTSKVLMDSWTDYRVSSSSIGGSFNYGSPVSFSVVVWLALAVYIYSIPYLIPQDSSIMQATVGSTISVLCLLLLHVNASSISNPFKSSRTFQTVTEASRNCTQNLVRGLRFRGDPQPTPKITV